MPKFSFVIPCYRSEKTITTVVEEIKSEMLKRHLYIMVGDAMILSEPDDTHMTVFNPDEALLELIREIASGEGLYVWEPYEY